MRILRALALAASVALTLAGQAVAQNGPADVPRKETLILENPEGTIKNAGWFNIWAVNAGGAVNWPATARDGHILVY